MKFAIVKEQRDFFNRHGHFEFDALLTPHQIDELLPAIESSLAERLGTTPDLLYKNSPLKNYLSGHDIWRTHPLIKKIVTSKKLAEIAAELVEQRPLRLGYDQYFPFDKIRYSADHSYVDLLEPPLSLEALSCLDKVVCGLMICLTGDESEPLEGDVFPKKAGNGVFFQAYHTLDFARLKENATYRYLLIVYVENTTVFLLNEKDPHTHFIKQLGYVFGDRLSNKYHPIVYR